MKEKKEPLITMEHFSFTYENAEMPSVTDVSLEIYPGEVILLTGKSGCGKTTLTRCLNGLIPDFFEGKIQGKCSVMGMEIGEHETAEYASYVGSVFQDPRSQFFTLHVRTELAFPSENLGISGEQIRRKSKVVIQQFGMDQLMDKSIFLLSSGEKQKVAVASVYMTGTKIFVLDEPSANLDEEGTQKLRQVLYELKEQGCTIVVSEHKIHYLKGLVDRAFLMEKGKITNEIPGMEFSQLTKEWLLSHQLRQIQMHSVQVEIPKIDANEESMQLNVDNLSFYYNKKKPLWDSVSFYAGAGDIVGVVGRNGAGKSTLFRVLMGLEKQRTGTITVNGKKANKKGRRNKSFYVMQDVDYQLFAPSVLEEMLMEADGTKEGQKKAMEILTLFGLEKFWDLHPSMLSGGQKQRLSIALAYMRGSGILFMDEPTSGLDGENMRLVSRAIQELARRGCLIFVITHDYEFAAQTFRSMLVFHENGEVKRISVEEYTEQIFKEMMKNGGLENEKEKKE